MHVDTKNILIVEDDAVQRVNLKKMIEDNGQKFIVYDAKNYEEALYLANAENIDLFIFDIDLKDSKSGLELAELLRKNPRYRLTWMLFLTVRKDYESLAFKKIHCYDFLIKPYGKSEINDCLKTLLEDDLMALKQPMISYLNIEKDQVTIRVNMDEILFVEAKGRNCDIVTIRGTYQASYTTLKKIANALKEQNNFVKCHRSYIVNVHYIKLIRRINYKLFEIEFFKYDQVIPTTLDNKDHIEGLIGKV